MPPSQDWLADLAALVGRAGVVVLSGAGLSTESGIPDYRGPSGAGRPVTPMTYQVFTRDAAARRRYWARSHLGWRRVCEAVPNAGHAAVAALQDAGLVDGIVTQNVDGLHQAAGARGVVELHGSLDWVICLRCGDRTPRAQLAERLHEANPTWIATESAPRPDGDTDPVDADTAAFRVVDCAVCRGVLKPDVVFFGESVPSHRVELCTAVVGRARSLLVLGSSLTVLSGRRFVQHAARAGIPVAIINRGPTRGDAWARIRVDAGLGVSLGQLSRKVTAHVPAADQPV